MRIALASVTPVAFLRLIPLYSKQSKVQTGALTLGLVLAAVPVAAQYEVKIEPATHDLLLELALTPNAQNSTKVVARGTAWRLPVQVQDVKCGKLALERQLDGAWTVPPGCSRISWRIIPDAISDGEGDPSKQRTLAVGSSPWFLLAEPTSLLRPIGLSEASTIVSASGSDRLLGATMVGPGRFKVPPDNSAPEFYVLGPAAAVERTVGDFDVTYVADDPNRVERLGLDRLHAKALSYLSAIVAVPKEIPKSSRRLLVIWLAAQRSRGPVGGAAGSRSFVANYLITSSGDEKLNSAMTLTIIAHEQFHQLVDMLRGQLTPLPPWLSESLAQYYGLKAMLQAENAQSAKAVVNEFVDPSRAVSEGLLALNRRYKAGDRSEYGRFYSQGATLWKAVDFTIVRATKGRHNLDDYVRDLLVSPLPDDGTLPKAFIERLRLVAGPEIDQIVEKYVGH